VRLVVEAPAIGGDARLGDSICVSGCCLSVVAADADRLEFQLGEETLARTALGTLAPGAGVNLERSLRLADRLGGHLVTGHVDGVGRLVSRVDAGEWSTCRFAAPTRLLAQMAEKGSIAVSGVSLTVVGAAWATVRLLDIGVDLVLGVIMDRTRTPWGRYRVWMIIGGPILMVSVYQLFLAKAGIGAGYLIFWLLVYYLGTSIIGLAHSAWGATLTKSYDERSRVFGVLAAVGVIV
jgi:riboflavin synthase alpha subunit